MEEGCRKRRASYPEIEKVVNDVVDREEKFVTYERPNKSFANIIAQVLYESPDGQLFLADIYHRITEAHPYFVTAGKSWKNSVRHNLSQNPAFEKVLTGQKYNMWRLSERQNVRMVNGRLVNLRKAQEVLKRRISLPDARRFLEATSNPKLILPKVRRPLPDYFVSRLFPGELSLETPPWICSPTSEEATTFSQSSYEAPLKVDIFRRIDKETDVTPPTVLPKIPMYAPMCDATNTYSGVSPNSSNAKRLRRGSDPLLSSPGWFYTRAPQR